MADRYWVNRSGGTGSLGSGTGTWNDTNNWSATSGGNGGAGVPTSSDNVTFDNSSAADCTLNTTPTIINWTMSSGYSGATLSLGIYTVTCTGNVSIASDEDLLNAGTSTLSMSGASAQTIGNPTLSNAFNDVTIGQNVGLTDDLYVDGGVLTINANFYINTQLVAGTGYDIHLRGSGNVLVLNGYIRAYGSGNHGVIYFELDEDDTILNVPGGTGFGSNNSYTATAIRMILIGTIDGTFSIQGEIDNVDNINVYGLSQNGNVTFNTNGYDITIYSTFALGYDTANEANITGNFSSSTITVPALCRFQAADTATQAYNLQTSSWIVGYWSPYPNRTITFNVGTSSVAVSESVGEIWQTGFPVDCDLYNLTINPTTTANGYVTFSVQNRLTINNGKTFLLSEGMQAGEFVASAQTANINVRFPPGYNNQIGTLYLTGSGSNQVRLYSSTPGTQWSGRTLQYSEVYRVNVTDSEMVGAEIDALDLTNIDGGNNGPAWVFDDNVHSITVS